MIKKNRLRWFGHVERKDDSDWVKHCITWEVERIRQRGRPKKTSWDCVKNDVESLVLYKRMRSPGINGEGELRGQPANPGSPGKMAKSPQSAGQRVFIIFFVYCIVSLLIVCLSCPAALRDIFHTPMAQYSLFMLIMPLNTNQLT